MFCIKKLKLLAVFLPLLLFFSTFAYAVPSEDTASLYDYFPPFMDVTADSVILTDASRGQVLYGKNMDSRLHISLANKIMTALVVIERSKLDSIVTVSKEAAEIDGAVLFLEPGEKFSVEDLLYAIMLESYNDAAMALAEYVGETHDAFVKLMNTKATELNLTNTYFANATGLYDENQYTTAGDLAVLIRYAISNKTFNTIFSSTTKIWNSSSDVNILINKNTLFWEYDGVDGGKIGSNTAEKYSAVTAASKGRQRLISIVLDTPPELLFGESKELLRYGFENYRLDVLASKNQIVGTLAVGEQSVNMIVKDDVYYSHPSGMDFIKNVEVTHVENPTLPINSAKIIGNSRFLLEDGTVIDVGLYPDRSIPAPQSLLATLKNKINEHKDIKILLYTLFALESLILLVYISKGIKNLIVSLLRHDKSPVEKLEEYKSAEGKSAADEFAEVRTAEAKPLDTKPAADKPAEVNSAEAKSAEVKSAADKPADSTSAEDF